jgi:hypothetical protein
VIAEPPIVPGDATLAHNGIVLRDGKLALGGACAPVKAKRKASKKGTRLGARWKSCTGVTGPVKLTATTDATCQSLTGKVTGKKAGLNVALALLPAPAGAKKRTPCGDTSWAVETAPIVPGDATLAHNGIVLRDGKLALGGVCAPVKAKRKASKKGTRLGAKWKSCTGVTGPVKLTATTDATCQSLTGKVTGKKAVLNVTLAATAVPTGDVLGQVRIVRAVAVPAEVRSEALAQASAIAALGKTVAPDGSSIANAPIGAGGWRVRIGDKTTSTDKNGMFRLRLDPAPPTELELVHPAETDPSVVFFALPHLVAAGGTPVPVDVEVTTQGACGMDEAPADEPAYCAALPEASPVAMKTHAAHHAHHHAADSAVAAPITFTFKTGALGSYPSYSSTSCADQDGGFGFSGETTFGALTNYLFSTCDTQVTFGCCDNELGSIKVSIKTALGKLTGFKPISCNKNHKGRQCQDVLQGDVGVQVPAGKASGQANIQSVFGLPASVTQPVTPGASVPVTVHHNGCYGETAVEKTLDELHGSLSGTFTTASGGMKIYHYTTKPGGFTFTADVPITYTAGSCPPGKTTASDAYDFSADGDTATVVFVANCASTTTTTTVTSGSTTTTIAGRAVHMLFQTGSAAAGSNVCLSRITGGCVAQIHQPNCAYVHLHANNEFGIGIDGAGPYQDPHISMNVQCGYGEVLTVPGCGPDSVPPC